jgi:ABC-type Zn uptake system ZnuABC Zn-binding protein ZnuA
MDDPWKDHPNPPRVVVTIPPLYSFVRAVGGDRAGVKCLCTNRGPHGFQYDIKDTTLLKNADLFLAVGLTLDDTFADRMSAQSDNPKLHYVKLGKELPPKLLRKSGEGHGHDHAHGHDHGHGHGEGHEHAGGHKEEHGHGEYDPHVWLGIDQAIHMVEQVREELTRVDPDGADEYATNARKYVEALKKLKAEGDKLLARKKNKRLISFHESLGYFAKTFGLEIVEVIEVGPGDEPTPGHLKKLVELCVEEKKEGKPVGAIAVEPQYPRSTSATTLRNELKERGLALDLVEVDPMETADAEVLAKQGAGYYAEQMRRNLKALAEHLP